MADIPLYEGDTISVLWGNLQWECRIYRSDELWVRCNGATIRLDPPWETWSLLCCAESVLTLTRAGQTAAINALQPGAIVS
jgi:hypothetical protein